MKPDIPIFGALRVEYRVQLRSLAENCSLIASEQRFAGGSGAVAALALCELGARVRLGGNAIGDDSHGRFLLAQLRQSPNLELDIEVRGEVVTPYAILIRGANGQTQTLLSPDAANLDGTGDYPELLGFLRASLRRFVGEDEARALVARYDGSFGDFGSLRL